MDEIIIVDAGSKIHEHAGDPDHISKCVPPKKNDIKNEEKPSASDKQLMSLIAIIFVEKILTT